MDSFEQVVSEILWMKGYWVRTSVKIDLTLEEKRKIGRPSSPRWELDIVAYSGRDNLLRVVECKSYIDSLGVQITGFDGTNINDLKRYKLFNDSNLRRVVFKRLLLQLNEVGACPKKPKIKLCLACGKIRESSRARLQKHFRKKGWELWDEQWLRENLRLMARKSYENQVSAVVAKMLLRGSLE
jgi:hypothetical protein